MTTTTTMKKKKPSGNSDDEDGDDTFYYHYASAPAPSSASNANRDSHDASRSKRSTSGSGGLTPSKSTIRVKSGLLTHQLRSTHHLLHLRQGREGYSGERPRDAVEMNGKVLNKRTLTASIAADNGRAAEFIKKKVYKDKSRCYECGSEGHLSYDCPRNQLGPRERNAPKRMRRAGGRGGFCYLEF